MSLLLEALKKAEKAKEDAQRRAEAGAEDERAELQPQAEAAPEAEAERRPVMTRDQLPEISTPLEIVSDDLKPAASPAREPLAIQEDPPPAPRRREAEAPEAQAGDRATARKVFEAKFREPNPRMPFYITMGGLGAFALGTVIYFYLQLRPPPPLVNANPPRQSNEPAPPAVAGAPLPSATVPASAAIPGMPTAPSIAAPLPASPAPVPLAAAPRAPALAPRPEPAPEVPRLKPQPQRVRPAPAIAASAAPAPAPIAPRVEPQVNPRVESGYAAYLSGDAAAARKDYQQALTDDPANRDALLGMAALDVRAGRFELAEAAYLRLLQANPRDAAAHAGLVALRAGRVDPLVAESRLKSLLNAEPGAYALSFALGNLYAQQGRWAEAQQEFFKAAGAEPDNADYAYNLAVSLDHLRQPRLAREYYQRAVTLGEKRGASFDIAAARARLAQLGN